MTLSPQAISKIGKLIPRLASDHDGEVIATVRAIQRSLHSAGADLHDVVAALDKPPEVRVEIREKVVYRDRVIETPAAAPMPSEPEFDTRYRFKEVRATADRLLDPNYCELNAAEAKFVRHMRKNADKYKGRFHMTVKQADWFALLVDEYLGMEVKA